MKKALGIILLFVVVLALSGCDLFGGEVNITVTYTGTEFDGSLENFYLAIAEGAYVLDWPTNDDLVEQVAIEPSSNAQKHTFSVPKNKNYVALIYRDANGNGELDSGEGIRMTSTMVYVDEDTEVSLSYNF